MPRYCRVHPRVRISSEDEMFDGVCGRCEMAASNEEYDMPEPVSYPHDHAEDERRYQQAR